MSQGFIRGSVNGTEILCSLHPGWRARFDSDRAILTHPLHEPYVVRLGDIKKGETLPPESHFDGSVNA
jgi:hypothetical protein